MKNRCRLALQNYAAGIFIVMCTVLLAACELSGPGSSRWPFYTIIYLANGGSGKMEPSIHRIGVQENLSVKMFERAGHTSKGWALSPDIYYGDAESIFMDQQPILNLSATERSSVRLYSVWRPHIYTVRFDANNGVGEMESSRHVFDVGSYLNTNIFTKMGHNFLGWAMTPDGPAEFPDGYRAENLTMVDEGVVTLYAVWGRHAFEIAYSANGGIGAMINSRHSHDIEQNLAINTFAKIGHSFQGWARSPLGILEFSNEQPVKNLAAFDGEIINLYAIWDLNTYTVFYHPNGGDGEMKASLHSYGIAKTLSANAFTKVGNTFAGWSRSNSGPAEFDDKQSVINLTVENGDVITLFAVWRAHTHIITYNANGGTGNTANSTHTYGISQNLNANMFSKPGHRFLGWAKSPNSPAVFDDRQSVINLTATDGGSVTLYAIWGVIFTVVFNANNGGGTVPAPQTVSEGSIVTIPCAAGLWREGSVFKGWNTKADGTGTNFAVGEIFTPSENFVLYARWIVTWTAIANSANETSAIIFTFGVPVFDLAAADIIVSGLTAYVITGTLTGNGATWTLPISVKRSGNVQVSISRLGIESTPQLVSVMLPLEGNLSLTGTARVGETLTADTSNLGGSGGYITFQWKRGGDIIPGENGARYNVRIADVGWSITVTATRPGYSGNVTSAPTATVPVPGDSLCEQLQWLLSGASYKRHIIELDRDQVISPQVLSRPSGSTNITIVLRGIGGMHTISLSQNGTLLAIGYGVTIELDNNVTLLGKPSNNSYLVRIDSGGTLVMNERTRVGENFGGGINVNGGVLYMNGGEISGNHGAIGGFGGVKVNAGGRFYLNFGSVVNNQGGDGAIGLNGANGSHGQGSGNDGHPGFAGSDAGAGGTGGVTVLNDGVFTMRGGSISSNTGGNGQAGGRGGRGGDGDSRSTPFRSGGSGGRGGDGGSGSGGGHGAVSITSGGVFILYFGNISNNHGGTAGNGSRAGDGGDRGTGGSGGSNGRGGRGGDSGHGATGGTGGVHLDGGMFFRYGGVISNNIGGSGGSAGQAGLSGRYNGGNGLPGSAGAAGLGNGVITSTAAFPF